MTDRGDANLPQIVSSQRWQNLPIDLVFGKGRHVLHEAEALQPLCNVHGLSGIFLQFLRRQIT
jgi:hypothetical protein